MLLKNIFLIFVLLKASVMAEKFLAYEYNGIRRLTSKWNDPLYVSFINWSSCWFTGMVFKGCCIYKGDIIYIDNPSSKGSSKWFHRIDVKKGNKITYVEFNEHGSYKISCTKKEQILKGDLRDEMATCISSGCLTKYGWVNRGAIADQRSV
ncbi:hypothetical protein PIROE2DRAFT_18635 [Piromyces sp. E2]|nr:hypothetical protein PIROE2DRAFT_18635 [Piromyces sp. E2]|eukprot:OUM56650.1 hypothetical protein PIROE2DRAFT_18635 [Piromyces sp. E2]